MKRFFMFNEDKRKNSKCSKEKTIELTESLTVANFMLLKPPKLQVDDFKILIPYAPSQKKISTLFGQFHRRIINRFTQFIYLDFEDILNKNAPDPPKYNHFKEYLDKISKHVAESINRQTTMEDTVKEILTWIGILKLSFERNNLSLAHSLLTPLINYFGYDLSGKLSFLAILKNQLVAITRNKMNRRELYIPHLETMKELFEGTNYTVSMMTVEIWRKFNALKEMRDNTIQEFEFIQESSNHNIRSGDVIQYIEEQLSIESYLEADFFKEVVIPRFDRGIYTVRT